MIHQHIYDENGNQICCTEEEKINAAANRTVAREEATTALPTFVANPKKPHHHNHDHDHDHSADGENRFRMFLPSIFSFLFLITGLFLDHFAEQSWFSGPLRIAWYVVAYLPVGLPVLKQAVLSVSKAAVFSEFLLMSIATLGAFAIGEYPEGVAVMLFYSVGEVLQTLAVTRAKTNIKTLLDQRPDEVTILRNNTTKTIKAENAKIGDIIQLKAGEKLGLDGELISGRATFNTAALTGESTPQNKKKGEPVYAGMINLNSVSEVLVTTAYIDSKLSKILELVQVATAQKAPTELFIRKFAKIYTPIVVGLAVFITVLPMFFVADYVFSDWLYRALIFLVISCPCALVISIPLGYFGGIGAASRNGILFKGSTFLDLIASIQHVVMDKTGTLTAGVFQVQQVHIEPGFDKDEILRLVNALENKSTHPIATAIHDFVGAVDSAVVFENVEEIPGYGLRGKIKGRELLVGNFKFLGSYGITYNFNPESIIETVIAIGFEDKFAGYLTIADTIKPDAKPAVDRLKELGVQITMLSGDKDAVVQQVAKKLGIPTAFGNLLPADKVKKIREIKARKETVAFAGDGVNDAPVVALSDVGIAMGGLGSDATIETADIVIQDDLPSKIPMAINIGKQTKRIVWQNITLAFAVKAAVLILGAGGLATMWEAVFADVGVALLAIFNAIRIQKMKF